MAVLQTWMFEAMIDGGKEMAVPLETVMIFDGQKRVVVVQVRVVVPQVRDGKTVSLVEKIVVLLVIEKIVVDVMFGA